MLNPIIRREAKSSLRGWKSYLCIFFYVIAITGVVSLFVLSAMYSNNTYSFEPQVMTGLYYLMAGLEFGMIMLITPTLIGGSISGEREKQTLDLLLVTKMSPFSIVIGKLFSGLGRMFLMVVATLPVFAVVFYFGGVSPSSLLGTMFFIFSMATLSGCIAVFFSTIFRKTVASIIMTFIILGLLCVISLIASAIFSIYYYSVTESAPPEIIIMCINLINPAVGFFNLMTAQFGGGNMMAFFSMYADTPTGVMGEVIQFLRNYLWVINMGINFLLGLLFIGFATLRLNSISARK